MDPHDGPAPAGQHAVTMTIEEIDRALADWTTRLQRIDDNLLALETSPACVLLEGAGETGLDGVTRDRVVPALAAMRELFAQRSALDDVLGRAGSLRRATNRGDGLNEIERLLRGPSIPLPATETALADRGLLDSPETTTAISPDQLLGAMVASFETARDAVTAVDDAWTRLTSAVDRASAELGRLGALATALGVTETASLAAIRTQIEAARDRVLRDPLGATQILGGDVAAALARAGQDLSELDASRSRAVDDLGRGHALMDAITAAAARAADAYRRCSLEIADEPDRPRPSPVDPGRAEGLRQWLATLDTTMAAGRWSAVGVGIGRWLEAAQDLLRDEADVERASAAALDRRDELVGRLGARRQQAQALATRGHNFEPDLTTLGEQAGAALRQVPTRLSEASRLVADYEARLDASR